jgi:peptide/nickel transport system substrate-binding protein
MRCRWLIGLALVLLAVTPAGAQKKGGVLRVGILGEPPALDAHWSTTALVETLTNHVYEGLYTLDQDNRPIPMLAEALPTVSRDGLVYTFKLRQGVKFHNGKELGADDVVASLKRWGQQANQGKVLFKQVAGLTAVDRHTVELRLTERSPITVLALAIPNNFAAIYPKEIAEKFAPAQKVTEYVGTGPFRVAEWRPDQYLRMVRFDDYKPRSEPANGYGGAKVAHVDEVRWIPVPDVATRAAQVETGELDFADDLSLDQYDRLARSPNARPLVAKPYFWLIAVFNKKEGVMTSQKLRQAWQAAVDIEPIMKAVAAGRPEFYRLDSSLMFREVPEWHTTLPGLPYNERNVEKAKRLMKEAGYRNEPIRFMATREYKWMYDFAVMMKQQLEDVGFVIDLQVVDWATLSTRRFNPKEYDVFTTGIGLGAQFDPVFQAILLHVGGLDVRRGDPAERPGAGAGDRPPAPARPVGAADAALVREGAIHPPG